MLLGALYHLITTVEALDNGLAITPQMGWVSLYLALSEWPAGIVDHVTRTPFLLSAAMSMRQSSSTQPRKCHSSGSGISGTSISSRMTAGQRVATRLATLLWIRRNSQTAFRTSRTEFIRWDISTAFTRVRERRRARITRAR